VQDTIEIVRQSKVFGVVVFVEVLPFACNLMVNYRVKQNEKNIYNTSGNVAPVDIHVRTPVVPVLLVEKAKGVHQCVRGTSLEKI